jgi:tetratricopeptide (TPR) repeat protein
MTALITVTRRLSVLVLLVTSSGAFAQILPEVPEGAQAVSLAGEPLYSPDPSEALIDNLEQARADYGANPDDADNIIWLGRRLAYTGDYRGAIETFSEGIEKHPEDARMYRHRGHRYITIREFDRAIADLEKAAELIQGTDNEIEPDGAPNELGIPVSTLHGNIWYHLGLAYYLKHDWMPALRAYTNGYNISENDDNRVSTSHWRYMILCRMGRERDAQAVLVDISPDMNVIENMSYHSLTLFYKGLLPFSELVGDQEDSPTGSAVLYGAANWLYCQGERDRAIAMLADITSADSWAGFGFIAAEADLAAL